MERNHCGGESFGWLPRHLGVYQGGRLVGAMPLYEKYNSLGEFVFDHAWAQAYEHMGLRYYPKLVSAIPYTPVIGQRLLSEPGREDEVFPLLLEAALHLARKIGASMFDGLFPSPLRHPFMERVFCPKNRPPGVTNFLFSQSAPGFAGQNFHRQF